jgi:hypothetical protein
MRGAQTSAAQGDQEGNVSDLKSLAINVANLTQSRSNHQREDQSCAVIALVPVGQRRETESVLLNLVRATSLGC